MATRKGLTMAEEGTYQGWANRETWAANLWFANDQGIYESFRDLSVELLGYYRDADDETVDPYDVGTTPEQAATSDLAEAMAEFLEELALVPEASTAEARRMVDDIGSRWRIEWHDIADGWIHDAAYELAEGSGDDA